ncbi:ATP-binding cassette domain-containing protein [Sedimentibacter hydroxybenzoicus DSM 7310]|uniref:ATP-binding cassette domain-containing protein n=1 Tax=Sedimentibacter hydroxybenzoicus DSM 7310 TaxID=1123245 RepID=A0A974BLM9_SEDHY|nr:ATP-binding cassette domain-containing protein [Sedimentibacter hydroxybenzoicus]NYB74885.1 ATP-binding cassette domain-containing protein [Sedimentibacter hydroxybenzoicus DSM 7310]
MVITVENAIKDYGDSRILDIDNLTIKKGIYVILGSNGSGKSTLLSCISGLNSLTSGNILYNGNKLDSSIKNSITILLQKPYLFRKTSYENIISGLKYKKINNKEIENRLNKYIHYFNVEELLNKKSHWLSGGERAKVALLRTSVLETEVTMLDEPTAAMDIESSMKAEELIKNLSKDNRTVIVVTHDVYQAKRIADYVIFMDKGKILEMGDKDGVLGNPKNKLLKQILNI